MCPYFHVTGGIQYSVLELSKKDGVHSTFYIIICT